MQHERLHGPARGESHGRARADTLAVDNQLVGRVNAKVLRQVLIRSVAVGAEHGFRR